ncbi:hypothetical protein ACFPRL_04970 [Pseudoclavibacter helvolus]
MDPGTGPAHRFTGLAAHTRPRGLISRSARLFPTRSIDATFSSSKLSRTKGSSSEARLSFSTSTT